MKTLILVLAVLLAVSGISFAQNEKVISRRAADTVTTASGLKYIITKKGKGKKLKDGQVVIAHYHGTLSDGTKFDASRDRSEPFAFTLGRKQVIRGWDEGFANFRVGDRATLVIPPGLGYGDKARPKIPANSTLVFEVEVLDVKENSVSNLLESIIKDKGIDAAKKKFAELKKKKFRNYYMSEADLNRLGYTLMKTKLGDAIEILRLNAAQYPKSFNVYDSLAEAYMENGDKELAIKNYKKSLELNPQNSNATEMLKKLEGKQ